MEILKVSIAKDRDGDMFIIKIDRADGTPYKEFYRASCPPYIWHHIEWRMDLIDSMETFIRNYKSDTRNPFYLGIHWLKGSQIADRAIIRRNHDRWVKFNSILISLSTGKTETLEPNELYSVVGMIREDNLSY